MVLGDIRDICIDFQPCFNVYNLVSVHSKIIKVGQMTTPNMILHVVSSFYRLVKFETGLSSLCNFGMAY